MTTKTQTHTPPPKGRGNNMLRPLTVIRSFWSEVFVIEEWAQWLPVQYVEIKGEK